VSNKICVGEENFNRNFTEEVWKISEFLERKEEGGGAEISKYLE